MLFDILISFWIEPIESQYVQELHKFELGFAAFDINKKNFPWEIRVITNNHQNLMNVFQEANKQIFDRFIKNKKRFCFVSFGVDQFTKYLKKITDVYNIKLPQIYHSFFDINKELLKFKNEAPLTENIQDIIKILNLQEIQAESQCQFMCKNIARIINVALNNNHKFEDPYFTDIFFEIKNSDYEQPQFQYKNLQDFLHVNEPEQQPQEQLFQTNQQLQIQRILQKLPKQLQDQIQQPIQEKMIQQQPNQEQINLEQLEQEIENLQQMQLQENTKQIEEQIQQIQQQDEPKQEFQIQKKSVQKTNQQQQILKIQQQIQQLQKQQSLQEKYVKLRGVPFKIRKNEIKEFLKIENLSLDDIQMKYNEDGKFSGICFVKLKLDVDFQQALNRNRQYLNGRYIEIFESDENHYEEAQSSYIPDPNDKRLDHAAELTVANDRVILKCRGLPFRCNEQDLIKFFEGCQIVEDGVQFLMLPDGRMSGQAFVIFKNIQEGNKAYKLNGQKIQHRYVEIFQSNVKELLSQQNLIKKKVKAQGDETLKTRYLKACGWPFKITIQDVIKFFNGFQVMGNEIQFIQQMDGRFSGNVIVPFYSEKDAENALNQCNKKICGQRYISLMYYQN